MDAYLKRCEEIIQRASRLFKFLPHLALASLLIKLLFMKELSAAFAALYVVVVIVVALAMLLDKAINYKLEEKKVSLNKTAEVQINELKSKVDSLTLRYGFEGRLP